MLRCHPIDRTAIKTTGRTLVEEFFRGRAIGQSAIRDAIAKMRRKGWLANYAPGPFEFDRTIVLVPVNHRFEPVFRCLDETGRATVPRGRIESRTRFRMGNWMSGTRLGVYGLAILAIDGCNVAIRGTSSGMAFSVNGSRYDGAKTRRVEHLVENATGRVLELHALNDDLRLRTVMAFDEFNVDVPGVLDCAAESAVASRWLVPPSPQTLAPDTDVPF